MYWNCTKFTRETTYLWVCKNLRPPSYKLELKMWLMRHYIKISSLFLKKLRKSARSNPPQNYPLLRSFWIACVIFRLMKKYDWLLIEYSFFLIWWIEIITNKQQINNGINYFPTIFNTDLKHQLTFCVFIIWLHPIELLLINCLFFCRNFSCTETLCSEQKYFCETCGSKQEAQKRLVYFLYFAYSSL